MPTAKKPAVTKTKRLEDVWGKMSGGGLDVLDDAVLSETELKTIADRIKRTSAYGSVLTMIERLPKRGRNYDWNVGSILQHFEASFVIEALKHAGDLSHHYDSIGLAWVMGEFKSSDRFVAEYLYKVVWNAKNPDAWWRAAYSLEQMGLENAVNILKRSLSRTSLEPLEYHLNHLDDKRSIIAVLVLSDAENMQSLIYPRVKKALLQSKTQALTIGCCWLVGRLGLIDEEILRKLEDLMNNDDYELRYYTFFALQRNANERLRSILENAVVDKDPLIRKMAVRGLISVGSHESLNVLEGALLEEKEPLVISEMSQAIYHLKNPTARNRQLVENQRARNENGLIVDRSDKWYGDPYVYSVFADAEDPENLCFDLVRRKLGRKKLHNPIDLAAGNGRMAWQIIEKLKYDGTLYAVDASKEMCDFMAKKVRRERKYTHDLQIVEDTISGFGHPARAKSSFIISSFGFPSRMSDKKICREELEAVYNLLEDDGVFVTIGWDETFNDELSEMWFKFISGDVRAKDFEQWRVEQTEALEIARNCGLTWLKQGLTVPLQFGTVKEASTIMGALFGRDAASYIASQNKKEWTMSMGITMDTKKSLARLLKK